MSSERPAGLPLKGEPQELLTPALPLRYFAAAALWLLFAATGLLLIAADLARGDLFGPRIIAVTHAFTLGVITNAIFGALHQFLPAVVGMPMRHPRVARLGFVAFTMGVPSLVAGLWSWNPLIQAVGWAVLLVAVGLVSWNLLPARRFAQRNRYVGAFVSAAHSALGLGMLIAAARIGHALGWWEVDRLRLLAAHFHLGVFGFGSLTVVAFGSRMLPAFLGAPAAPDRRVTAVGWIAGTGLVLFTAGAVWPGSLALRAGGAVLLVAAAAHLMLLSGYFRRRAPGPFDPGLGFIAAASTAYLAAVVSGGAILLRPGPPERGWALYAVLAIIGWLVMFILGVMHRVTPRLIVLQLAGQRRPLSPGAQRAELIDARLGWGACGCLGGGLAILALGIGAGLPSAAVAGAIGFLAGAGLILVQAVHLAMVGRAAAKP